jgi:hypothetical protein
LRRNFGKSAALATGFRSRAATGSRPWTPTCRTTRRAAELVRALESGYDLVSGWKLEPPGSDHQDAAVAPVQRGDLAGGRAQLHDFNCGFKLYRREVVESIECTASSTASCPRSRTGAASGSARCRCTTAAPLRPQQVRRARFVNGFLDLMRGAFISTSALKPLHVFGRIGLAFSRSRAVGCGSSRCGSRRADPRAPLMLFGAGSGWSASSSILMGCSAR